MELTQHLGDCISIIEDKGDHFLIEKGANFDIWNTSFSLTRDY